MDIKRKLSTIYNAIYDSSIVLRSIYALRNSGHRLQILSARETIERIQETNASIARFGDGEFELILRPDRDLGFQARNDLLSRRLAAVLESSDPNLLVCIPYALNSLAGRTNHSTKFWFNWGRYQDQHHRIVDHIRNAGKGDAVFGDSQITRPYIAYRTDRNARAIFPAMKRLWEDKDILFVEGEQTRLGVGNDLFDNVRSVKRILCPATNAFECYEKIVEAVRQHWNGELILLALGPTATVLAAEFSGLGMQALDLGHVDIEYEWFRSGARGHDQIDGKFTNEADGGNAVAACEDDTYLSQIVCRVGC